jgi:lysophospholipase L1-like esterase
MPTAAKSGILHEPEVIDLFKERPRSRLRIVFETIAACLFAIVFLEVFFRLCGVGGQEFLQPDSKFGTAHIPNKQVTWRLEGYSDNYLSSCGLRDTEHQFAKPNGTYRIALLGDSATEGLQVDLNETFGKVAERILNEELSTRHYSHDGKLISNFEVINFGCSGYSNGQELLQYRQDVTRYNPDIVFLLYNRGDSTENSLEPNNRSTAEPRPYFYVDKNQILKQDDAILLANADKLAPNPVLDFLRNNSRIYGAFSQMNMSLTLNESRYRKLRLFLMKLSASKQKQNLPATINYPKQDALLVTCSVLQELAAEAHVQHTNLCVMTFPNWVNDPVLAAQYVIFEPFAKVIGAQYLDLTKPFKADAQMRDDFLEFHFSKRGHALVARKVADIVTGALDKEKATKFR